MGLTSTGNFQPSKPHPPPPLSVAAACLPRNGLFPTHCRVLFEHRLVSLVTRLLCMARLKKRDANKGYKYTTCIIDTCGVSIFQISVPDTLSFVIIPGIFWRDLTKIGQIYIPYKFSQRGCIPPEINARF